MNRHTEYARKLVSVNIARAILGGIGRTKLYELIGSGDLRTVKLGGRTFFVEAEVIAYAEALPRGTPQAARSSEVLTKSQRHRP